jgi:peptide/nickel transport system substrate-binding protein
VLVVGALVAALAIKPWQHSRKPEPPHRTTDAISYAAADNSGPALRVADAQRGGRLTVLTASDLTHLDPAQAFQFQEVALSQLVSRTLTTVRPNADGSGTLVGDLATDPGQDVNSDCRTWRFTIRDGVKFADGTVVTAQDVAYGIARSFGSDVYSGYTTLQQWLAGSTDYSKDYDGPGTGDESAPGVSAPDARTLELRFPEAHCDAPYAAALPNTAAVPHGSKPSAEQLDLKPPATGPYQVTAHTDATVTLTRNPAWDAATDPLRTADPDEIDFRLGMSTDDIGAKLVADADSDQRTISWSATNTAAARASGRVSSGSLGYNVMLGINNSRITSLSTRQAISYAIDKNTLVGESIGSEAGKPATTVIAPGLAGYQPSADQYPYSPDKARSLLGSGFVKGTKLTVATSKTHNRERQATHVKHDLEAIGFSVTIVQLDGGELFSKLDSADDPYDLAVVAYIPDWPSGFEQLRALFGTEPAWNFAHLNNSSLRSDFQRLEAMPARKQIAEAGALDARIIADTAAVVPLFTLQGTFLYGSHVSATTVNSSLGVPDLLSIYVTT